MRMGPEEMQTIISASEIVFPYVANLSNKIWNGAKTKIKNSVYKSLVDLEVVFKKYLKFSYLRNYKIKTFLYSDESRPLYSLYVHNDLRVKHKIVSTKNINSVLDIGHYIVISGTGGSGKTTLLKHLFLNCIRERELIPVLVDLRSLNNLDIKDIELEDIIYEILQDHHLKLEEQYYKYSIEQGCYLFILDGYDELNNEKIDIVGDKIKKMGTKYSDNYYIVSSREDDRFAGWNEYVQADILPMKKEQAIELISKLEFDENKKQHFIEELEERLYEQHRSFASNPLLLSIMLLTYKDNMEIPDNLSEFYEQAYTALFSRHDTLKDLKREKCSKLSQLEFKDIFAHVCFKSFMNEDYEFTENQILTYINTAKRNKVIDKDFDEQDFLADMLNAVCLMVKDGLKYKFSHRSFQEYFAAYYTCKLNDEYQKIILRNHLEKDIFTTKYIFMVRDMQRQKFESIVIAPIGREILEFLEKNGWRKFIENMYFHIDLHKDSRRRKNIFICAGIGSQRKKYFGFMKIFSEMYCAKQKKEDENCNEILVNYLERINPERKPLSEIGFDILDDEALEIFIKYTNLKDDIECLRKVIEKHEKEAYKGNDLQNLLNII